MLLQIHEMSVGEHDVPAIEVVAHSCYRTISWLVLPKTGWPGQLTAHLGIDERLNPCAETAAMARAKEVAKKTDFIFALLKKGGVRWKRLFSCAGYACLAIDSGD